MKRIQFIIAFTIVLIYHSFSQNLILDNSFEGYSGLSNLSGSTNYRIIGWGTFDDTIWTKYSSSNTYITFKKNKALDGKIYVMLKIVDFNMYNDHTYLQAPLKVQLVKGKNYNFKMYVRLSNIFCNISSTTNQIAVAFENSPLNLKHPSNQIDNVIQMKPDIRGDENVYYSDTANWYLFSGSYTAKGDEQFIIIGNFNLDQNSPIKKLNKKKRLCDIYFDIDNLSLYAMESLNKKIENDSYKSIIFTKGIDIKEGIGYILKNFDFEYDKSSILLESYPELDTLVEILKSRPLLFLEIHGYTDSIGTFKYNQILSLNRARSVSDYLISKGISKDRIVIKGFGNSKPIASNNFEEGRRKNRRVELYFYKK